jgi:hypothetical protein
MGLVSITEMTEDESTDAIPAAFRSIQRTAYLSDTSSTTNPTWIAVKSNMGLWGQKRLTCDIAFDWLLLFVNYLFN